MDNLEDLTIEEIKNGYTLNSETNKYLCNMCGEEFEIGEIFKIKDRYFDAEKMIKIHIHKEHSDRLQFLIVDFLSFSNSNGKAKLDIYHFCKPLQA